ADGPVKILAALEFAPPATSEAMLGGLAAGWPADKLVKLDEKAEAELVALPANLSPGGLLQLIALVKRWGQEDKLAKLTTGLKNALLVRIADGKLNDTERIAAARDLAALGNDEAAVAALLEQITPQTSPALTRGLLEALGDCTSDEVGSALVARWSELTPSARATALSLLLRRTAWTKALLAGLEEGDVDKSDLSIDQAQQLSTHPDKEIAGRSAKLLASGGRLPNPDRQKVVDDLMPLTKKHGDKDKGKGVFEKNCAKCHRHGDLGQTIGPDLTGVA